MFSLPAASLAEEAPVDADVESEQRPGFYEIHDTFEAMSLRIRMDKNLNGFIEGEICEQHCEEITVTITPDTKAYENNVEVPLRNAEARLGRFAAVMYEMKTMKVSEIHW
jgi:hypothetical protein